MTDDIVHRCAAKRKCRNKTRNENTGQWEAAAIPTPTGLCDRCTRQVRNAYQDATTNYQALQHIIGDEVQGAGVKVSGTPTPPMPLNGTVIALSATLSDVSEQSVVLVAPRLGIEPKRRQKARGWPVREHLPIIQATNIIPDNLDKLLDTDTGTHTALDMLDTHQQIEHVIGTDKARSRLAMPCPVCGKRTLGIDNGDTDVTCNACDGRWKEREYSWLATLVINENHEKETAMLKWLLAEANWKLDQLRKLAALTDEDLDGIEGIAVARMIKEIIE